MASPNRHGSPSACPLVAQGFVGQVEARHRHTGEPLVHPAHHLPFTDADLEDALRRQPVEHAVEGGHEPAHHALLDGCVDAYLSYVLPR